jgi:glycosyltransferase involved in cell wall biosynthesis
VNFTFEFGSEDYRALVYSSIVRASVPVGVPIIVSDDSSIWNAAGSIADKYPMIGVLHGDQDVYYDLAKKYLTQLSLCICVSGRIRATMVKKNPYMEMEKLYTIPCGINLPAFAPHDRNDNITRLIFIGRLTDYEQRAEDLVLICAMLHKQAVAFHLDIVGNSDESKKDFSHRFAEAHVGDLVSFHGWQSKEHVQELLNKADVLLLTSNSEGMPLVMMEALASGCAFTGTRVSGIEDYERKPEAADCVAVYTIGNIEDAVNKIRRIAAIPVRDRQLAARKLAETEFSMQVCLDKYVKALGAMGNSTATARNVHMSALDKFKSNGLALGRLLKMTVKKQKN